LFQKISTGPTFKLLESAPKNVIRENSYFQKNTVEHRLRFYPYCLT